ncbi:MAG: flagellar M-ring protein FliF, partial [Armatimonadetes bacterium]|nr:flagellar M-ring protein FliF [Armatimonadota bacterium]
MNGIRSVWNEFAPAQKFLAVGVLVAVVAGLALVATTAAQPRYALLFANLDPEDAGAVVERLREQKTPYRLAREGRAIEVPEDHVHEARLHLASEGLPRGGGVGFELFDRTSLGGTDFTQRLNFQRALEGELTRTISRLEGVREARVHLALPEPQLYLEKDHPPTASVVLNLQPGRSIGEDQVAGIVHLVSGAVEGLRPADVAVISSRGEMLTAAGAGGPTATGHMKEQQAFEKRLEEELRAMVDRTLGPGKAVVRVNARLNFDQREVNSETYQPGRDGKGVLASEQTVTEVEGGSTSGSAGGVPGVGANLGEIPPETTPAEGTRSTHRQLKAEYLVSKQIQRLVEAPGRIERLAVSVLVDAAVPVDQQTSLRQALA